MKLFEVGDPVVHLPGNQAEVSHLVEDIHAELREINASQLPLVIGGIIPEKDAELLRNNGVQAVFTPKDHDLNAIMSDMVAIIRQTNGLEPLA